MTEKQQERIRLKIKRIKSELAADKKRWGGFYDDSRGLRYLPLELYIKLDDYSGGKRYINWFYKNFPDDGAFPTFLFECSFILYQTNNKIEAQKKLFELFTSNIYVIDKFLGQEIFPKELNQSSNLSDIEYLEYFQYAGAQEKFMSYAEWITETISKEKFKRACNDFVHLEQLLFKEKEYEKRVEIIAKRQQLLEQF